MTEELHDFVEAHGLPFVLATIATLDIGDSEAAVIFELIEELKDCENAEAN